MAATRTALLACLLAANVPLLGAFVATKGISGALEGMVRPNRCSLRAERSSATISLRAAAGSAVGAITREASASANTQTVSSQKPPKLPAKPVNKKGVVQILFEHIDMDGDGHINELELQNAADSVGCALHESDIQSAIAAMNPNKDGLVAPNDFLTWYSALEQGKWTEVFAQLRTKISRDNAKALFACIDTDKNGAIDLVELQSLCSALGYKWPKEKAQQVLTSIDKDGNGVIDFEEFYSWYSVEGESQAGALGAASAELRLALQRNPFLDERRVFVRGFPPKANEDAVKRFFGRLGAIETITMLRWSRDGRPSGRCIVTFAERAGADAALRMHRKHMGPRWLEVYRVNCGDSEERMPLEPSLHGALLGVGGGRLKSIETDTGARLFLQTNGTRGTLYIKGTEEERAAARKSVQAAVGSETSLRIPIEPSMAGLVIGAGGKTRARIERESGARVSVREEGGEESVYTRSVVLLRGSARQTSRALELVLEELESHTEEKRRLHPKYHGNLMGRGGATVTALQRETGTRIRFVREPEGAVFIRGPPAARAAAWELILAVREVLPRALEAVRAGPVAAGALRSRPGFEGVVPPEEVWAVAVAEAMLDAKRLIAENRPVEL